MTPSVPWYLNPLFLTPVVGLAGVIVGGLMSGIGGWMIGRANRSHEFERERRRRKQDCIEAVMEKVDDTEFSVKDFSSCSMTQKGFKNRPTDLTPNEHTALLSQCMKDTVEASKAAGRALHMLERSYTKLMAFGFAECAKRLRDYCMAVTSFMVIANEVREGQKPVEDYVAGLQNVVESADSVRAAVTEVFATL